MLLNTLDFIIIGLLALSTFIGFIRGFMREAFSLVTWIMAVIICIRFGEVLASLLLPYIHHDLVRKLVAYAILFIATLILGALFGYLFSQLVRKTGLGGMDRFLGLFFGFGRGLLLIALMIVLGEAVEFQKEAIWKGSFLIPKLTPFSTILASFFPSKTEEEKKPWKVVD